MKKGIIKTWYLELKNSFKSIWLDQKDRIFQQKLWTQGAAAQVRVTVVWRVRTCEQAKYQRPKVSKNDYLSISGGTERRVGSAVWMWLWM